MRSAPRRRRRSGRSCSAAFPWTFSLFERSAAQSGQTAGGFQDWVERGLVGHAGIFAAQHAERSRMIFLRLLRPGLVAERDAELFPRFRERLLVGAGPGHELLSDVFL